MNHNEKSPASPVMTLADLQASRYQEILGDEPEAEYSIMDGLLGKASVVADAAGEHGQSRALAFLARICSMMLTPSEPAAPFQPLMRWSDGRRSFIAEDLSDDDLDLLAALAPDVHNSMLRARLADLVWLKARKKGIRYVRMAIDAYRAHPIEADSWHMGGADCWHRALQLALLIGAGAQSRTAEIEAALLDAFWRSAGATGFEPLWYVRPLYATGGAAAEAEKIAAQFDQIGKARLEAGRAADAESFFDAAEQWYGRAGKPMEQADMLAHAASCWDAQGDASGSAIARHHFYSKAIAAYREVPAVYRPSHGVDATIDGLRAKLAAVGPLLLTEMKPIVGPTIDLAEVAAMAVERVRGKTPMNALLAFCELHPLPNLAQHLAAADELVSAGTIGRLFGITAFSNDGRAVAKREGADAGEDAHAAQVHAEAVNSSLMTIAMTSRGMISPALDAMQLECQYTPRDFHDLARYSPLVPHDRVDVVAKALYAGYCRDYVQAIHILMPQFEHMVRQALKSVGTHTTTHDSDGIDMEAGLSTLVARPQMAEVFGADLTFTISAVMCEQEGPNLRNAVAHGQASSAICNSDYGVYAWWLVLRLVVQAFVIMQRSAEEERASAAEGAAPST